MTAIRAHPFVAIRNTVFFPGSETAISVGRPGSVAALQAALKTSDKSVVLLTQTDPAVERPGLDDLHSFGVLGTVLSVTQREGRYDVVVAARQRVRLRDLTTNPYPIAQVELLPALAASGQDEEELHEELLEQTTRLFELSGVAAMSASRVAERLEKPDELVCFLASLLTLSVEEGMAVLQAERLEDAQRLTLEFLFARLEELESGAPARVALHLEVPGESDSVALDMLRAQVAELAVPEGIRSRVVAELEKLERLDFESEDYQEVLGGLEMFLELPWDQATEDNLDLAAVEASLEKDLLGLEAVKEHLLDRLALTADPAADVFCLHGPRGVGKAAVARALARALGRRLEFARLGQLRGQAWDLPGARPGGLFEALRNARVMNPVVVLEEEELSAEAVGQLLELLEQRDRFEDDYLGLPLDLSRVTFVVTTTSPEALTPRLRERLQMVRLDGYSREEKRELARRHLWGGELEPSDEMIDWLVDRHTCEAGVAKLERLLDRVAARVARTGRLSLALLKRWLGPGRTASAAAGVGLATALGVDEAATVEALKVPGPPELLVTGRPLVDTATIARSLVQAHLGLGPEGLHLHLGGSVSESEGLAVAVALASALSGLAPRAEVGLAGRLSLSGRVDGAGSLRGRLLAARRIGLRRLVLPRQDEAELRALPASLRKGLRFSLVDSLDEVLAVVLPELAAGER